MQSNTVKQDAVPAFASAGKKLYLDNPKGLERSTFV